MGPWHRAPDKCSPRGGAGREWRRVAVRRRPLDPPPRCLSSACWTPRARTHATALGHGASPAPEARTPEAPRPRSHPTPAHLRSHPPPPRGLWFLLELPGRCAPRPFGPHTPGRPGGSTRGRKPGGQQSVQFGHAPLRSSTDLWQVPPVCQGLLSEHRGGSCPWSGDGPRDGAAGTSDHTPGSLNHTN